MVAANSSSSDAAAVVRLGAEHRMMGPGVVGQVGEAHGRHGRVAQCGAGKRGSVQCGLAQCEACGHVKRRSATSSCVVSIAMPTRGFMCSFAASAVHWRLLGSAWRWVMAVGCAEHKVWRRNWCWCIKLSST